MDFPTIDADIYGKIKVYCVWHHQHSKRFKIVRLKIVPHGVSNFKVLRVTLVLVLVVLPTKKVVKLHAHLVQGAG